MGFTEGILSFLVLVRYWLGYDMLYCEYFRIEIFLKSSVFVRVVYRKIEGKKLSYIGFRRLGSLGRMWFYKGS